MTSSLPFTEKVELAIITASLTFLISRIGQFWDSLKAKRKVLKEAKIYICSFGSELSAAITNKNKAVSTKCIEHFTSNCYIIDDNIEISSDYKRLKVYYDSLMADFYQRNENRMANDIEDINSITDKYAKKK